MKNFKIMLGDKVTSTHKAESIQALKERIKNARADYREADSLNGNAFYLDSYYFEIKES